MQTEWVVKGPAQPNSHTRANRHREIARLSAPAERNCLFPIVDPLCCFCRNRRTASQLQVGLERKQVSMAALKKNIWLLFFLLVLSSTVLLVSISISRWNSLTEYYRVSQQGLAAQWFGAFSSILEQQEAILTLMGEDLLKREANRPEDLQARLDDLMNLNPDFFSGFALISP